MEVIGMNFNETSISAKFSQDITNLGVDIQPQYTHYLFDSLFMAVSDFLGIVKSKDVKTALVIADLKGNFRFAALVGYHPNENEDIPGNWSFEFTFNENDIDKNVKVYNSTDTQFLRVLATCAKDLHNFRYASPELVPDVLVLIIDTLKSWLDLNAVEGEEKTIELPGFFTASVAIENGEKIFSVTPDGNLKRLVKGDAELE